MQGEKPISKLVVVMGVSGCGKSTIATQLAKHYSFTFVEADDFHSEQAKAMMAAGQPLTNKLRAPWIDALCAELVKLYQRNESVVMACSALVRAHREQFRKLPFNIQFIFLDGKQSLIAERLRTRGNHFLNPTLLASQFETLERPDNEVNVEQIDIAQSSQAVLEQAVSIAAR